MRPAFAALLIVSIGLIAACEPKPEPASVAPPPPQKTPGELRQEAMTRAMEAQGNAQLEAQAAAHDAEKR